MSDQYLTESKFMWSPQKIYKPVQPVALEGSGEVKYSEILPDERLQSMICCYWELKTSQPLDKTYHYKVVSDGCMDMFFEMKRPDESFAMGFSSRYVEFPLDKSFHYVGVRFFPVVFPMLFKVDASEVSGKVERLEDIDSSIARFISNAFQSGQAPVNIQATFDDYFLKHLRKRPIQQDRRLENAVQLILSRSGSLRIENDIDTGLSPRQLRRLFHFYIGDTAKVFSKVVRFQKTLHDNIINKQSNAGFAIGDGYFDQAHFIKDFKNFYGATPGRVGIV